MEIKTKYLARQGDLIFKKIDQLPTNLKFHNEVLVRGESTGHAHKSSGAKVFEDKTGLLYLQIAKEALITHEEHKTIRLGKGLWSVIRQREYTSDNMTKVVVD